MSISGLNPLEKRAAVSLAAVFGFRMLGLFMLMPVFAIYGHTLEGFSPIWIGLAIGAYGLTQAILQIPMGMLSDRFGRRRIIVIGLILFAIGSVIAALAESVYMVTLGRAIQGTGAIASAVLALAADLTRDEQRPKVMAVIGMCIGMSFALALIFGPMLTEAFGLSGLFWITAMFALAGIVVVLTLVPSAVNKAPRSETVAVPALLSKLVRHPQLVRLDVGVLVLHLMMTAVFVSLPQLLIKSGMAATDHWQLYLPVLIGSFFLMVPFIIIAAKKRKEREMFIAAVLLLTLSLFGMFVGADSLTTLVVMVFAVLCRIQLSGSQLARAGFAYHACRPQRLGYGHLFLKSVLWRISGWHHWGCRSQSVQSAMGVYCCSRYGVGLDWRCLGDESAATVQAGIPGHSL